MRRFIIFLAIFCTWGVVHSQVPNNEGCALSSYHQVNIQRFLEYNSGVSDSSDSPLSLNLLLGNKFTNRTSTNIYLQIDLTNNSLTQRTGKPLNIALVLDRSASMSQNSRLDKLKIALKEFCKLIGPNDYVSIITYDNNPLVIFPAQQVTDLVSLSSTIDNITLGGGTNIWGGMYLGYLEVMKYASANYCNRLILLSDGDSNVGVTSSTDILNRSKIYNAKGIETSTIGMGNDINFELLHLLAKEGKGLCHFINDCDNIRDDILNVLDEELLHLLSIPNNVSLSISCPKNVEIQEIYGFDFDKSKRNVSLNLGRIGTERKVILVHLKTLKKPRKERVPIDVTLTYKLNSDSRDYVVQKNIVSLYDKKGEQRIDELQESDVQDNYIIAHLAQELEKALRMQSVKDYYQCTLTINRCLDEVKNEKDLPDTENFSHLYNLFERQRRYLQQISSQK